MDQFSNTEVRKQKGLLPNGTILQGDEIGNFETSTSLATSGPAYKILGTLGGGGQGNTYLAALVFTPVSSPVSSPDYAPGFWIGFWTGFWATLRSRLERIYYAGL